MASYMDILSNPNIITTLVPLIFFLVFIYVYYQTQANAKKTKKYHPLGANVFSMLMNYRKVHDYLSDRAEKYRTYRFYSPLQSGIMTADPANVEHILMTNFQNYGKGKYNHDILKELLGDGIFTVDGEEWREQRKVASHEFSMKVLRDFSSVTFKNNTIKLGNILSEAANNMQIIDMHDLFLKATMDSIVNIGFGIDLDNMSGSSEEDGRFTRAFDDANTLTYPRYFDPLWKIKKYFNIGSEAELKKNIKVIDEFIYKLIQMKTEEMDKTKDEHSFMKKDILWRFLQLKDKNTKYIRDIIINFLLAGKDPIAVTMTWFIYLVCKHPEVQDRVAKEIKEATNTKEDITNVADFATYVSELALGKMHYLHAVLTETLRLYPPLPSNSKTCFSDDVLPDGFNVKKGDVVIYLPYAMGRMKFIWGDDAHEFKPERWLDENGCFRRESPFKFTVFQAGLRICLGQDFAYRQMKIFSAILLGCFIFKLSDENHVPRYQTTINLHVDGPLQICVFNRFALHDPEI